MMIHTPHDPEQLALVVRTAQRLYDIYQSLQEPLSFTRQNVRSGQAAKGNLDELRLKEIEGLEIIWVWTAEMMGECARLNEGTDFSGTYNISPICQVLRVGHYDGFRHAHVLLRADRKNG